MALSSSLKAALIGLAVMSTLPGFARQPENSAVARIETASVTYREPGEFLRHGLPVNGPLKPIMLQAPITIMRNQVTRGEYDQCVAAAACPALDKPGKPDHPVTGVNYEDATAYARWLSARTGERWRLPTDQEWALAAGSRYKDDAYTEISDPGNPSKRWIAVYTAEAQTQAAIDPTPMPAGHFGRNEHGLADLSGNVWEWTSTCYIRHHVKQNGQTQVTENCGVRVAEGRHRALMIGFIRDPKAGACSVGIPPANLGIRLVREESGLRRWLGF